MQHRLLAAFQRNNAVFIVGLTIATLLVASMAIPGIYPAQRVGPWVLVDGGIVDPVPASACAAMGAGIVISVSLGKHPLEPLSNDIWWVPISTGDAVKATA